MVEHGALLLGPWRSPTIAGGRPEAGAAEKRRDVIDPSSGRLLGFVRRPTKAFGWLLRQADEICETEDASLVATVRRPWLVIRSWEIYDAENKRRGITYGTSVLDGAGNRLARLQSPRTDQPGRFLHADGQELATLQIHGQEVLLRFTGAVDPFTRMALLGAALSLG